MVFDYYFVLIAFTIVLTLALIILISDNNRMPKQKKVLWITPIALFIPAALAEYFGVLLNGANQSTLIIHILLKVFELSISPIIVAFLIMAFNGFRHAKKLIPIIVINITLQVITGFTGFLYYFDENNVYCHNSFYWLYTVVYVICGLFFFLECFRFSRHYQNHNFASLLSILIFLFLGLSIHTFFSELRADWLTLAIASNLFYTYYNALAEQTDSLTCLLDRKSYDALLKSLKKKAVFIMFDVDNFKKVNDVYGHDAGDVCLQTVASAILRIYKHCGFCYRIGGDEFCVISRKKINVEALNHSFNEELERLRKTQDIVLPNVSFGYSKFNPNEDNIQKSIKNADAEMYKMKSNFKR